MILLSQPLRRAQFQPIDRLRRVKARPLGLSLNRKQSLSRDRWLNHALFRNRAKSPRETPRYRIAHRLGLRPKPTFQSNGLHLNPNLLHQRHHVSRAVRRRKSGWMRCYKVCGAAPDQSVPQAK